MCTLTTLISNRSAGNHSHEPVDWFADRYVDMWLSHVKSKKAISPPSVYQVDAIAQALPTTYVENVINIQLES